MAVPCRYLIDSTNCRVPAPTTVGAGEVQNRADRYRSLQPAMSPSQKRHDTVSARLAEGDAQQ